MAYQFLIEEYKLKVEDIQKLTDEQIQTFYIQPFIQRKKNEQRKLKGIKRKHW